ncbi:hypothetical protein [Peribacillus simplex]|uniref:hypothetical protein n=1 Tax=Peribacillus simplex TaxID=1478 RepID=UPI0033399551
MSHIFSGLIEALAQFLFFIGLPVGPVLIGIAGAPIVLPLAILVVLIILFPIIIMVNSVLWIVDKIGCIGFGIIYTILAVGVTQILEHYGIDWATMFQ